MTIINGINDLDELENYIDGFYRVTDYLALKRGHLDHVATDPNYEIMNRWYVTGMSAAWDQLPDWAKKLLSEELE